MAAVRPPPDEDAAFRAHVRLACVPGVGPRSRLALLARFGSPEAVLAAGRAAIAAVPGLTRGVAAAVVEAAADDRTVDRVLQICRGRNVRIVLHGAADYPALLGQIDDPPGLLFVRGGFLPCDAMAIAIVGSRHATAYGRKIAWRLAGGLARAGYTVVSGLARGIDAAAHRGALDAGGRTIAVLGGGVLAVYPPEHDDLATEIAGRGAVVSESPPLAEPGRGAFPQRNRIVSGLSLGTIVVQGAETSGAMITARLAGEQGREVFAVPGPIDCRMSRGCHRLIRDGARLVEGVDDVLDELGPLFAAATSADGREVRVPAELQLGDVERSVLDAVDAEATDGGAAGIDEVVAATGLATSQVLATLGVLEMRRILRRLPGNRVARHAAG
ncbi:MAG: DNA-processing protein DprA [Planctomycetaceae bacterium]